MKDVIILGKAPSGKVCPFDTEVWGLNDVPSMYPGKHFDKLFAVDPQSPSELQVMHESGATIVSIQDFATERFPVEEIRIKFGSTYYMASAAFAVAYAIYYGYEKIRLYGVDHNVHSDYLRGKGSVEYWLGRAQERGIIIETQPESHLLKSIRSVKINVFKPAP